MLRWTRHCEPIEAFHLVANAGQPDVGRNTRVRPAAGGVFAVGFGVRRLDSGRLNPRNSRVLRTSEAANEIPRDDLESHPRSSLVHERVSARLVRASSPDLVIDARGGLERRGLPRLRGYVRCSAPAIDARLDIVSAGNCDSTVRPILDSGSRASTSRRRKYFEFQRSRANFRELVRTCLHGRGPRHPGRGATRTREVDLLARASSEVQ